MPQHTPRHGTAPTPADPRGPGSTMTSGVVVALAGILVICLAAGNPADPWTASAGLSAAAVTTPLTGSGRPTTPEDSDPTSLNGSATSVTTSAAPGTPSSSPSTTAASPGTSTATSPGTKPGATPGTNPGATPGTSTRPSNATSRPTTPAARPPAPPSRPAPAPLGSGIYFGGVGDIDSMRAASGLPVGLHKYGSFEGAVPDGRMVTANTGSSWATVAAVAPGSTLYNQIVRWADTLKARGQTVFFSYSHEPEQPSRQYLGGAEQFKAAFARVATIFAERGASNVRMVWQMTDWAFRTSPSDRISAAKWYPGDAYVDVVGADTYNWYTCGSGQGRWVELSSLASAALAFARAHGKKAALPEFGVTQAPQRAQWLANAHAYLAQNSASYVAAYYFNHPPTNSANNDCVWNLSTPAEYASITDVLRDGAFRS